MKPRDIPNLITGLRILLVAPILWFMGHERYFEALVLFLVAGVSDAADGFMAKRFGWTSQLGGILDPLADKLLLVGIFLVLGWQGDVPMWLVVLVLLRDVLIVTGAISYHYLIQRFEAAPLLISKLNTLVQLMLVLAVLFSKGVRPLPQPLLSALIYLTALTTLLSGIAYLGEWGRRALRKWRRMNAE